ncbi:F-box/kelch-repeat protein At3g06240-like [Bidens hawaiensis]|uniref:F-box/kelch-repeat protein At3g06240-like n=1 Tax=Bidens hawaiensis TaxID=980011 RepID=UPI00404AF28C
MSKEPDDVILQRGNISTNFFDLNDRHLIGSSNGLVCVSPSPTKVVVINPSTREVKNVTKSRDIPETGFTCQGFGYDSKNDDYKIILVFQKGENNACFHVFSLRYNIWKVIAEINYVFISRIGILCEGALHWLAYDTSPEKKIVVLSLRFSDEKFMEVPMPDDARYNKLYNSWKSSRMLLGNMNGCLCLFWLTSINIWVMNKERSWEYFGPVLKIDYDVVHMIKLLKNYVPNKRPLCHQVSPHGHYCLIESRMFLISTPTYLESLVSPHFHKKPQRKRRATSTIKSNKVSSCCDYCFYD